MTHIHFTNSSRILRARWMSLGIAAAVVAVAACADSNVPFFTAPTSVPNSPGGIQNFDHGPLLRDAE